MPSNPCLLICTVSVLSLHLYTPNCLGLWYFFLLGCVLFCLADTAEAWKPISPFSFHCKMIQLWSVSFLMIMFEEWITEASVWEIPRWDVKKLVERYLRDSEVWTGLWPGGKKKGREEENNAGQQRLPQHWGAKLSAAVWEWCDQRLLKEEPGEQQSWRVKTETSPMQTWDMTLRCALSWGKMLS